MAAVAVAAAIVATALLVVRELIWRHRTTALQEKLVVVRTELREHEQRTHVDQVVSGLAQELKSPLQGVIGNTELVLAAGGLGAETDDLLQIQEHAARAVGIVRHLLAFTETTALHRRWQDINALVERAAAAARSETTASGTTVHLRLADRLPLLYVDGRQLEKVIATLLSRRGDAAASAHAAVSVQTRRSGADDRIAIEIDDRSSAGDEPAWSGDLAACRQILNAHGGTLEVERSPTDGFQFHLELPVTAAAAGAAASVG